MIWSTWLSVYTMCQPVIDASGTLFVACTDGTLRAIAGEDGRPLWSKLLKKPLPGDAIFDDNTALLMGSGRLIVGSTVEIGRLPDTSQTSPPSRGPSIVWCIDPATGRQLWQSTIEGSATGSSPNLGTDGSVLIGSDSGLLYALDSATGKTVWTRKFPYPITVSPAVHSDRTFLPNGDFLYSLDAGSGKVIWRAHVGATYSSPTVTERGAILVCTAEVKADRAVGNGDMLVSVLPTGRVQWRRNLSGTARTAPVCDESSAYVATEDGIVRAVELDRGWIRWKYKARERTEQLCLSSDGELLFVAGNLNLPHPEDGRLYRLDTATGRVITATNTGTHFGYVILGDGPRAYVVSRGGQLSAIE